jgi:prepilin-type N-terminal cleavage/methylation domain-containing protein
MQKKKGFTLIEVLVVMLISTLILSLVAGTMIYITNSAGRLIQEAEDIDMAKNIEKYLRGLDLENLDKVILDDDGNLVFNGEVIFTNTGLIDKNIIRIEGEFIKCYLEFDSGKKFDFILGINTTTQSTTDGTEE